MTDTTVLGDHIKWPAQQLSLSDVILLLNRERIRGLLEDYDEDMRRGWPHDHLNSWGPRTGVKATHKQLDPSGQSKADGKMLTTSEGMGKWEKVRRGMETRTRTPSTEYKPHPPEQTAKRVATLQATLKWEKEHGIRPYSQDDLRKMKKELRRLQELVGLLPPRKPQHPLDPAATRERMSESASKRWARYRAEKQLATNPTT